MLFESVMIVVFALLIDAILGEVNRYHPLVGFGKVAIYIERKLNRQSMINSRLSGLLALAIMLLPLLLFLILLQSFIYPQIIEVIVLYLAIGRKSLGEHALKIAHALASNDLPAARKNVSMIVSRDTENMSEQQVVNASIESVIENSSDAIFAAIFWFMLAGAPGVLVYRLANTLDAMWGYKNDRYIYFGWAAARFDDVLNGLPARLTVFSFAVLSRFTKVWSLAFEQGLKCSSKNAGPVMAAGAAALNIKLGGQAYYQGEAISKPELGCGNNASVKDIRRALTLVDKTLLLWLAVLIVFSLLFEVV